MDKKNFKNYIEIFLEENSKLNLISKKDEEFLWEKHICDSLSIKNFFDKYSVCEFSNKTLLDIGTGGGFPSVPIAINYPELKITAIDSIQKKIRAIDTIKQHLDLKNLTTVCDRVENLKGITFDFITTRAVSALKTLIPYALPLMNKNSFFIAYKSLKVSEEIKEAQSVIKKYNAEIADIIEYTLPLEENYTRNLVIIKK